MLLEDYCWKFFLFCLQVVKFCPVFPGAEENGKAVLLSSFHTFGFVVVLFDRLLEVMSLYSEFGIPEKILIEILGLRKLLFVGFGFFSPL
jgi:hypothetical protein